MSSRILLVEDDEDSAAVLRDALRRRGFEVQAFSRGLQATQALTDGEWDVVVTDVQLGGMTGIELCSYVAENRPDVPVVVITGHSNVETAIAAIRAGAYDFITKPIAVDSLVLTLQRAINHRMLKSEVRRLRAAVEQHHRIDNIVGDGPAIRRVFDLIERVADSDASVLITGESGTGKELVARAVHTRSPRKGAPFIAVNCAAMPASLLESELFGHVRGAFTDAKTARQGLFLQANGGTLFLDEVGELPLEMQPKLLRALQERKVRPVGGDTEIPFETRLITATNRELETEVDAGRFRSDLYYRINVVQIRLPPLRARREDTLTLAHHFLKKYAGAGGKQVVGIASPAAQKLIDYHLARQRPRAGKLHRARRRPHPHVRDWPVRPARQDPRAQKHPARAGQRQPRRALHARRNRKALHPARAHRRKRQQVPSRPRPRPRPPLAVSPPGRPAPRTPKLRRQITERT